MTFSIQHKSALLFIGCISIGLISFAQKRDINSLSPNKKHDVAHKLIEEGGYYTAITILKEIVAKDTANKKYIFKLAEAYYKARDYKNAELWYPKLKENTAKGKNNFVSIASYHYAECLKYNGKYEQAREAFQLFANSNYKETKGMPLKQLAKNEIKACEYALSKRTSDVDVTLDPLGSGINSGYSDFSPALKDDNTLIFSSLKSDSVINVEYGERHNEHIKLYESDFENGAWSEPREITKLSPRIGHAANGSYSTDRKKFYFTRCKTKSTGKVICNIYVSKIDSATGEFEKPIKLSNGINHKSHTSTQPVIGKREIKAKNNKSKSTFEEVLYFSSDMKGSYGGMDIWYSVIDADGEYSYPANCGKTINSIKDEITPFYDNDAGALYYSSNFVPGFGGFDVVKAKGWATKWQKPENLKMPINTNQDDTYYTLLPDNKLKGFLVSNREGGIALTHPTCCDDIWSFEYKKPSILLVNAVDSITNSPIKDGILVEAGKYEADDSLALEASIDYDTVFANTDKHFLKVIGLKDKIDEYYIIGATKNVKIQLSKPGYKYTKVTFHTDSVSLASDIKVINGSMTSEINQNVVRISLLMTRGDEKPPVAYVAPVEKKDTVKIASTLKEEFFKIQESPKVDVFVDDTTKKAKKVIEEIDFTINLTFEYKEIALNKSNLLTLDSLVYVMKSKPNINYEIDTHTDGIGSEQYNLDLSYKRASFIANYIIKKGINKKRVVARGLGESKPLVPETNTDGSDNIEARRKNRRTEIRLFTQ